MNKITIILTLSLLTLSCSHAKITDKDINIFFNQLIGEWYLEGSETMEVWGKDMNGNFSASVFKYTDHDTILVESIRITKENDLFYYEATVNNQNNSTPVKFEIVNISKKEATFKNSTHDFPQKIAYYINDPKNLKATISGKVDGKEKIVNFTYQRK